MPLNHTLLSIFSIACCLACPCALLPSQHEEKNEAAAEQSLSSFCYFIPPQGWEIQDPRVLSPRIQISFFKKKSEGFCPSINLAIEPVEVSQADYLKAVKQIQEKDRSNRWRHLGKVHTSAGVADLTEIDTTTDWGPVRMLQLILVKHSNAYVLTAAALKKEIPGLYKDFQTAFRSLQLTEDLLTAIPQSERRETLKAAEARLLTSWKTYLETSSSQPATIADPTFQKEHWVPFQDSMIGDTHDMGAYWQVLFLKNIQLKLQQQASLREISSGQNNLDQDIKNLE